MEYSQTGIDGNGKNPKSMIFFSNWEWGTTWAKKVLVKFLFSAEKLGMPIFSLPNLLIVTVMCPGICFQLFEIYWTHFDINIDFKSTSKIVISRFGSTNQSLFVYKNNVNLFSMGNLISKHSIRRLRATGTFREDFGWNEDLLLWSTNYLYIRKCKKNAKLKPKLNF